jgi:hypothetical protein
LKEIRIASLKSGQTRVLKPDVNFQLWWGDRWSPDGRDLMAAVLGTPSSIDQIDAVSGQILPVFFNAEAMPLTLSMAAFSNSAGGSSAERNRSSNTS